MALEQIWAPWRLEYIVSDKDKGQREDRLKLLPGADPACFLCQSAADEDLHRHFAICRGDGVVAVMNRYPYNNGHLLVAPAHHLERLDQLSEEVQLGISRMIARLVAVLEKTVNPHGFNIGVNLGQPAGAGLPGHLHWHIVPRWNGDTNFMPVLAAVNVIPQSLEALWEVLSEELAKA